MHFKFWRTQFFSSLYSLNHCIVISHIAQETDRVEFIYALGLFPINNRSHPCLFIERINSFSFKRKVNPWSNAHFWNGFHRVPQSISTDKEYKRGKFSLFQIWEKQSYRLPVDVHFIRFRV